MIINDTTLRDGEQAPKVAFNSEEKLKIASLLSALGADEIEAGIPAMGKKEQQDLKRIVALKLKSRVMSWNRALVKDVEASLECGIRSLDLSIPVSNIMQEIKYGSDRELMLKNLEDAIALAKKEGCFVCIGGEDSSRADMAFLKEVLDIATHFGIERFRYCDTIGILTPLNCFSAITELHSYAPHIQIEMHTHNDFGMATANAVAGFEAGAASINTTVVGVGERAGNASFEQVLMSRKYQFKEESEIESKLLRELVKTVCEAAKIKPSNYAPIIGSRIFSHESGIHADGMLKNKAAYEPFSPKEVGGRRYYPIGKHSGSATLVYHLKNQGIKATKETVARLIPKIREIVTERKKVLNERELKTLYCNI